MSAVRCVAFVIGMTFAMIDVLLPQSIKADPSITFEVRDDEGVLIPANVHLRDEAGQAVKSLGLTDRIDHLAIDGRRTLKLAVGTYVYAIERSPEWERSEGTVAVGESDAQTVAVTLERLVDLTTRSWYSGDLHIHRDPEQVEQLMRAADLHVGPVITWWRDMNRWKDRPLPETSPIRFDGDRFTRLMAGEDERAGGALLFFGLNEPADITGASREFPSPLTFVERARQQSPDLHLDIEKPFWWDVPVWLALAKPDTIGLANNHMCRDRMYENEGAGRPRDANALPPPLGNGYWTQQIYYQILNAGLRLPPSAGSASGVLPNPVGYNRVYVQVDGELTWDQWWDGLRAGRSFVTNGPLLLASAHVDRPAANQQFLPGGVFQFDDSQPHAIAVDVQLWTRDAVPQLELVQNGRVVARAACRDVPGETHTLKATFNESGWFLVRAITDNPRTFRFASSAPFYVECGGQPRISRAACQFFLDWTHERIRLVTNKLNDPVQRDAVLESHRAAERFWRQRIKAATEE